jgi:hypothetical protein
MLGCSRRKLVSYIDNQLKTLVADDGRDSSLTPALQRVAQHALLHVKGLAGIR